jgi:hypothetical protein
VTAFSLQYPGILQAREHARNNCFPDAQFYNELAGALNHTLAYRKKCVFTRSHALGNLFTGEDPGVIWRWYFTTGYGTQKLALLGLMGLPYDWRGSSPITNTDNASITIAITKVGGGGPADTVWNASGGTATPTDAPSEWGVYYTEVDVDPASDYYVEVTSTEYCRIISLTAHEIGRRTVDDTVNYYTEIQPVAGAAILDSDIQRLVQGPSRMLSQNGALQVNWCRDLGASRTRTSADWVNLIDGSSASPPTSTSPGYRFVTTGRNTRSATTIPVSMYVYASMSSGVGYVTLRDTSGTDVAGVAVDSSTPGWFEFDGDHYITVGTGQKFDIGFYSDGINTLTVYAVSVFEAG